MADDLMKFTEDQFPALLASLAKHYGNAVEMARRFGIDPSNLRKACLCSVGCSCNRATHSARRPSEHGV